jgi:hypothetical protein
LRRHLEERLGARVTEVHVREVDFVRETTLVSVRYVPHAPEPSAAPEPSPAPEPSAAREPSAAPVPSAAPQPAAAPEPAAAPAAVPARLAPVRS